MEYITTPAAAERNAAAQMRALGYDDAEAVTAGPDGGIDVRSSRAVGQVKFRGANASRPELQNLYGARGRAHGKELWFFAATGYTAGAVICGDELQMLLFTYEPHGELKPANVHAQRKLQSIADARTAAAALAARSAREAKEQSIADAKTAAAAVAARSARRAEEQAAVEAENERRRTDAQDEARVAAQFKVPSTSTEHSKRPPRSIRMTPSGSIPTAELLNAQRAQDAFEARSSTPGPNVGPGIFAVIAGAIPAYLGWLCFAHRSGHVILWILLVALWFIAGLLWSVAISFFVKAAR